MADDRWLTAKNMLAIRLDNRICPTDHACLRCMAPMEVVEVAAELIGREQDSLQGAAA